MIEIDKISKKYGLQYALRNISFQIKEAVVFGLLGPNGAGKTTLLRILTQIIMQDSGQIKIRGKQLYREDVERFGYLPEERGLYKKMKVGEQLIYLARLKGVSSYDARTQVKFWMKKFDAEKWWNKRVEELSKGMQQKVQFIASMVFNPEIIILDEPFSGFDPINSQLIKDEIASLKKQGKTIILSTHDMYSVEEMCDDIALIHDAELLHAGNISELKEMHKQNIFEIVVENGIDLQLLRKKNVQIIENKKIYNGERKLVFKMNDENQKKEILKEIMGRYNISQFRSLYPGMQEIFISLVKNEKNA